MAALPGVFGRALPGMYLGAVLPKHHLSSDSKDIIRVAMAMIATLAAPVVGSLIHGDWGNPYGTLRKPLDK
jgi:hypothetical protein